MSDGTLTRTSCAGAGTCTAADLTSVSHLAISADGTTLFATNGSAVVALARLALDGSLSAPTSVAIAGAAGVAVAPDGDAVVASLDTVTVLRETSGVLAAVGCVVDGPAASGCGAGHDLAGAGDVRIMPGGTTVLVAASTASAVTALSLAADGTLSQGTAPGSCAHNAATTSSCSGSHDLDGADAVIAVTGGDVIVASGVSGAIVTLRPQHAPQCVAPATAIVERAGTIMLALGCTDADNDPLLYAIQSGPDWGTLGSPDGTGHASYRPTAAYIGADQITYSVTDGANSSNTVVQHITVRDTVTPRLRLTFVSTRVTGGNVHLQVRCLGNDKCNGTVVLRSSRNGPVIGRATFRETGSVTRVTVRLYGAVARRLRATHHLSVTATATVTDIAHNRGTSTASARLTG